MPRPHSPAMTCNSISATHTNCAHAQTSSIGGVAVSSNHHATWEGVVLKDNLSEQQQQQHIQHNIGWMGIRAQAAVAAAGLGERRPEQLLSEKASRELPW